MSQRLYTSFSVFRYWQNGAKLTEQKVRCERKVDIHFNPKIGADWQPRGQQKHVATPGQNEKYYLAGALHSGTGKVVDV